MLTFKELEKLQEKNIVSLTIHNLRPNHDIIIVDRKRKELPNDWDWERVKIKLKKVGFEYQHSDGGWYCDLINGIWEPTFS